MKFFHAPNLTAWPPYLAKQTLLLISVLRVLFYRLNISFDSIKMMCGCLSQVAMLDVSAAILDNSFKTSTPFIDTSCYQWNAVRVFATRWLSLASFLPPSWIIVVGGRLVAERVPQNSVIHGINIRAICRPHVRFNEVDLLFVQIVYRGPGRVLHPTAVSTCNDDILLWCQAADPFEDDIAVVWAVNFRSRSMKTTLSSPYEILRPTP